MSAIPEQPSLFPDLLAQSEHPDTHAVSSTQPTSPTQSTASMPAAPPVALGLAPASEPSADSGDFLADDARAEDGDGGEALELATAELIEWKAAMRRDFEEWLATVDAIPPTDGDDDGDADELAVPDLYSLHEELSAANAESRKSNRRTAEAMSQWGQTLARFEETLAPLREATTQLAAAQPKAGQMSRAHCLVLVEVLDRMHRLTRAFQSPPVSPVAWRSWWARSSVGPWRTAWETQRQALDILVSHVESLLGKEGVTPIETGGQLFDPAVMMAVASEPDATRPAQTVIEEVAAGYRWRGELLRAAHVKVTRPH